MDIIEKLTKKKERVEKEIASFNIDSKLLKDLKNFKKARGIPKLSPLVEEVLREWLNHMMNKKTKEGGL